MSDGQTERESNIDLGQLNQLARGNRKEALKNFKLFKEIGIFGEPQQDIILTFVERMERDPLHRCYLPGVPRIMYMPYPFEITQTPTMVGMSFEYTHASRLIYTDGSAHLDGLIDFWMGDSRGRWEGDTLVVDVALFNGETWFDRAGNFHSPQLHVVERYTPISPNHIIYEATIEDPEVFTRPWTIRFPLYRRLEDNVRVLDYECLEYEEPFVPWHESPAPGVPGAPDR